MSDGKTEVEVLKARIAELEKKAAQEKRIERAIEVMVVAEFRRRSALERAADDFFSLFRGV